MLERIYDEVLISKLKLTDYITIISSIAEAICFFNWNFCCHLLFAINWKCVRDCENILSENQCKENPDER